MWTPGLPELGLIVLIILLLFGVGKLPEAGAGIGKGLRNFKRALKGEDDIDVTPESEKQKALEEKKNKAAESEEEKQA